MTLVRNTQFMVGEANHENVTTFLFVFCKGKRVWCMDDHVCNVLYNVNRFLCKDDHEAFCEGP